MALFDAYVMVDWSGCSGRRQGRPDCIWIAYGCAGAVEPATWSPSSRTDAEQGIRAFVRPLVEAGRRVLIGADFAFGYPRGFASLLPRTDDGALPAWRRVWRYLRREVQDDLGTTPGRRPTNRSNRFDVANRINGSVTGAATSGPFWCTPRPGSHPHVPQARPPQPFRWAGGSIESLRLTDRRAGSDTPFRLFGTGSVGSQVLTGVPWLERLRSDPCFAECSAVWPFETGWAPARGAWLDRGVRIVHAEIYPSVRAPLADAIRDRGQVRAAWRWARDLDRDDLLVRELAIPHGVTSGSDDDRAIRGEEGWILGCPR